MYVVRKGSKIEIDLDSEGDARGFYAAMYQHPEWVTPEEFTIGKIAWDNFCSNINSLVFDYPAATRVRQAK